MGASAPRVRPGVDYSRGVAITSSIRVGDTTIQPVRYGRGSNLMGALGTILVDEPGALHWAAAAVGHPVALARTLWLRRWSERTVILLVMQARESTLRVRLTRAGRLTTVESTAPAKIPVADDAARVAAELIGGEPGAAVNEAILGTPMTAHILGGACVGTVVDRYHRVVAAPGLHVVDGAAVNANLGVNPSLTIAAQAERATALWPSRGEEDPRPPLGSA
jgi:cholesterol oxidase